MHAWKEISQIRDSVKAEGPIRSTEFSSSPCKGRRKTPVKTLRINFPLLATRAREEKRERKIPSPIDDDAVSSWRKIWIIPAICIRKISRRSTFPRCHPFPASPRQRETCRESFAVIIESLVDSSAITAKIRFPFPRGYLSLVYPSSPQHQSRGEGARGNRGLVPSAWAKLDSLSSHRTSFSFCRTTVRPC